MSSQNDERLYGDMEYEKRNGFSTMGTVIVLGILFIPSVIMGYAIYSLLRHFRQRLSVVTIVSAIVLVSLISWWSISDYTDILRDYFSFSEFSNLWNNIDYLRGPLLTIYLILGVIGGWIASCATAIQLKTNPLLREFEGRWTHGFEYRKSPFELFKRKVKIDGLKSGKYRTAEEAPLGLDEDTDNIISRFNDEVTTHTLITGGSGSGKALHKDTLIPTIYGMKTVENVFVDDIIYNEKGSETRVVAKFQPMTEDHYQLTFSDGTIIKSCGDHLWTVIDKEVNETTTIDTREIAKAYIGLKRNRYAVQTVEEPIVFRNDRRSIDSSDIMTSSVQDRVNFIAKLLHTNDCIQLEDKEELGKIREIISSLGDVAYEIEDKDNGVYQLRFNQDNQRYITNVQRIEDNKEDYYCFTVDSPSHLYLCSESYIPTHNTISMLSMIKQNIEAEIPTIIIDLKRSPEMAAKTAKWCHENGGTFYHFVNGDKESYDIPYSSSQALYDPLKSGSNTSKSDMLLGMREYNTDSAVYKNSMQQLLQVLMMMITAVKKKRKETGEDILPNIDWDSGGVYEIASAIKTENFIEMLNECSQMEDNPRVANDAQDVHQILSSSNKNNNLAHAVGELQGQMRTIIASEYGEWMKTEKGEKFIDLYKASTTPGSVVLFSLNSDDEKVFAQLVGSIIMSDITRVSALRRNNGNKNLVNIYIDEFQALIPDSVTSLLEKARESGMGVTLAQQSLSQVMKSVDNGEAYLQSILDTVSNFVFHSGSGYETAERMSKILGKEKVEVKSMTRRQDKFLWSINWSRKRQAMISSSFEDRWIIDPSEFMHLSAPSPNNNNKSESIIIKKASADNKFVSKQGGAVAVKAWMIPESEILENHYQPSNSETQRIFDERHGELDDNDFSSSLSSFGNEALAIEIQEKFSETDDSNDDTFALNSETSLFELRKNEEENQEYDGFTQVSDDVDDNSDDWGLTSLMDEEEEEMQTTSKKREPRNNKSSSSNKGLPTLPEL